MHHVLIEQAPVFQNMVHNAVLDMMMGYMGGLSYKGPVYSMAGTSAVATAKGQNLASGFPPQFAMPPPTTPFMTPPPPERMCEFSQQFTPNR